MIATYAAALCVVGASLAIGQAVVALCGVRSWSWLSPAVGLSVLCAICWATVRLPGDGAISTAAAALAALASLWLLRGRIEFDRVLWTDAVVAAGALLAASLPFLVEGRFGILGTSFNPDMSQHLLAAEGLSTGSGSELLGQGYPLGPHAIVVALEKGLGIGLVQGFSGLTVAVAVLAALTALAAFPHTPVPRRVAAALVVGLPYLVASYFAQGAFKETMQALLVLAFVLALREASQNPEWEGRPLRLVPAALIAVGSVFVYSFAGLIWLAAILLAWLALERRLPMRALLLALVVFLVGALPELGRMIDFRSFETFDPDGPGLGNLFGQISPFTALGIWFSGDFRVAAGDGAVPAVAYYLGAGFAAALLAWGVVRCVRGRESAILAGAASVIAVYLAARLSGTPYQAAKALEVAAPVLTLGIVAGAGRVSGPMEDKGAPPARVRRAGLPASDLAIAAYLAAAGLCSLLVFANAPVGPTSFTPGLAEFRAAQPPGSTLVLASDELLDAHGERFLLWELRGGRVCVDAEAQAGGSLPRGIRWVLVEDSSRPPFRGLVPNRTAGTWKVWGAMPPPRGPGPCPLIAERQARQGPEGGE